MSQINSYKQIFLLSLFYLEDGGKERPGRIELVVADEEALVAVHHVEDEALVCVWQVPVVARAVGQVERGDVQLQTQAGHLVVDLEVDALVRLDADDLQSCGKNKVPY